MIGSELITFCNKTWEPDETSYSISDANWLSYFNECLNEARPFLRIQGIDTIDTVSGTASYALPSDFDFLYKLWDTSTATSKTVREVTFRPNLSANHFYIFGDKVYVKASTASVASGLTLLYNKIHATLATITTISIEDPYMIGYYALSRAASSYALDEDYQKYYNEYIMRRKELISKQDGLEYSGNEQPEEKKELKADVSK